MNLTGRFSNGMDPVRMRKQAIALQNAGRRGDTMLAHINPREARMLKRRGGSGTINPITGLPEFYKYTLGDSDYNYNENDNDNNTSSDGSEFESNTPDTSTNTFDFDSSSNDFGDTSDLNLDDFVDINDTTTPTLGESNDDFNNTNTLLDGDTPTNTPSGGDVDQPPQELVDALVEESEPDLMGDDEFKDKVYTEALALPESYEGYLDEGEKFYKDDPTRLKDAKSDIDDMQTYGMSENPQTGEMEYDDVNKATGALNLGIGGTTVNKDGSITKTGATKDFDTASDTFEDLSDKAMGTGAIGKYGTTATGTTANTVSAEDVGEASASDITADTMSDFNASTYMNPYISNVLDNTISRMDDSRKKALMNVGADASARGAFGGSRHGLMEADVNQDFIRQVGDVTGTLMDRGYNRATDLFTSDANRNLTADSRNQIKDINTSTSNADRNLRRLTGNADRTLISDTQDADRTLRSDTGDADRNLRGDINRENLNLGYGNLNLGAGEASGNLGVKRYSTFSDYAGDTMGVTDKDINRRYTNINALTNMGMDDRTTNRMNDRFDFGEFNRRTDYPFKRLGALGSIMSGAPIKTESPTYHSGGGKGGLF